MPTPERIPGTPHDWLVRARSNLAHAKMDKPDEVLWEDPCFEAQQAAEKAFKAVLLHFNISFRYTHNLQELISTLLDNNIEVPDLVRHAAALTQYAVETRYPGLEPVTEQDYHYAIKLADDVLLWAQKLIEQ